MVIDKEEALTYENIFKDEEESENSFTANILEFKVRRRKMV